MVHLNTVGSPGLWIGFLALIFALLALDLGVFHRKAHEVRFKEALGFSAFWICLALLFGLFVYLQFGAQTGLEYLTGYIIEKALSVDNIFVFVLLFSYFKVPQQYQHRVLFFGILGALIMRGIFIVLGAALIQQFEWILYIFGIVLIATGVKLFKESEITIEAEKNILFRLAKRIFPVTTDYHGPKLFTRIDGKLFATPLFLVLIAVEVTDVLFAIDSIPAIFAITTDPFVVFSSNIFAILGLRALYFLLEGAMSRFIYLRIGLAFILAFIGFKMLVHSYLKIPIVVSLLVICGVLTIAIVGSLIKTRKRVAP